MRKFLLLFIVLVTALVFTGRLFYLQIYDTSFAKLSENNAVKTVYDFPQRGYIFDRNGSLLVQNQPSYDVMVIPREVKDLDTVAFCELLHISKEKFLKKLATAKRYSPRLASPIIPQLTKEEYASLSEKIHKHRGFFYSKKILKRL